MTGKTCSRCGESKPLDLFPKALTCVDGHRKYCKSCKAEYSARWFQDNKERTDEARRLWHSKNREKTQSIKKKWRDSNPQYYKEYSARYRSENKELIALRGKIYRENNPGKRYVSCSTWKKSNLHKSCAYSAARRARQLRATPAWANLVEIESIYKTATTQSMAENRAYHVDHIVPLKSKLVCGLHVESNLRVLLGKDNLSKNNRHWPDMP